MMLRLAWVLVRLLVLLPLWLLGLVVLGLGLALSPWGTGVLLEQGAQRGFYALEAHEGAPLDRLVLHGLRLETGVARVAIDRLELAWADDCLLHGRLCLDTLAVSGARVRLLGGDGQASPAGEGGDPPAAITLPFPLELRSLLLDDVDLRLADGTRVGWTHFRSGAVAADDTLRLLPTRLAGLGLYLPPSAGTRLALDAGKDIPSLSATAIDAAVATRSPPAPRDSRPLDERPRQELPAVTLPLAVEVPELVIEDVALTGITERRIDRLVLAVSARGQRVAIESLELVTPEATAGLQAQVELQGDYPLNATLDAELRDPGFLPELAGERLELILDGSLADLDLRLDAEGPVAAELDVRLDLLDPTLPLTATLTSDRLHWPLPGADTLAGPATASAPYRLEALTAQLEGSLLDYRLAISTWVEGPDVPRTRIALTGTGDPEHFAWTPLSLSHDRASIVSHGRIDWADALRVEAGLRLDNIDPAVVDERFPGRLNGNAELTFTQNGSDWTLAVPQLAIEGELREQPLALEASLRGDSDMRWRIDALTFRQGENRVTANGLVSEARLDLAGRLDLPALESLYPALSGRMTGEFATTGSLASPTLDLLLSGEALRFETHRLERLTLTGRASGLDDPRLDLQLDMRRLDAAGQRLDAVSLSLDGRLSEHRLSVEVDAGRDMPLSRAALVLEGMLENDRQRYVGRLSPLEVDSDLAALRLADPLTFEVDLPGSSARVDPFCLTRREGGALCLEEPLSASAEQGRAVIALRSLPLALFDDTLPSTWDLQGGSNAELVAEWRQGGDWQARLELESTIDASGQDAYGQAWQMPGARLTVTAAADPQRATLDLGLSLADAGELELTLAIDDPIGEATLDGRLRLDRLQLAPYRTLVTGLERLEGELGGEVRVGGDRRTPRLDGRLHLVELRVAGPELPLNIMAGEVELRLAGDRGDFDGFLDAEEGRLQIDGSAAWPSPDDWRIVLSLTARDEPLLAALPAFGRLRLAPDLTVRINPERLQVRGDVQVPWARLEVGDLPPSAVSPSPDEVIITQGDERQAARSTQGDEPSAALALADEGMAVDVQVTLSLGPDMQLEAYGLETALSGTLEVRQRSGPAQLFGDVNLVGGRFRAFGQDLLIREGQLLFSGPPDQPLLDFEAIRNPDVTQDGVIAGLRVTGSAAQPQVRVFSEPAMEEARALSYLLRGRAPDAAGGDTSTALTSALVGLTLGRTGGLVGTIGQTFGIQDLGLESAGSGEESQVVVSGQLTEDLRVSYGVGIFSPIAELTLRYTLWRNLYLEAISGTAQAVDLVYSFSLPGDPPSF